MKNYTITVNGNVYDVTVEENGNGSSCSTSGSTKGSSESSIEGSSKSSSWSWKHQGRSRCSRKSI